MLVTQAVQYRMPERWTQYDVEAIVLPLLNAKASILALRQIPFQRWWVRELQEIELKLEVAGTSKIEGAEFVGAELDNAVRAAAPDELTT